MTVCNSSVFLFADRLCAFNDINRGEGVYKFVCAHVCINVSLHAVLLPSWPDEDRPCRTHHWGVQWP